MHSYFDRCAGEPFEPLQALKDRRERQPSWGAASEEVTQIPIIYDSSYTAKRSVANWEMLEPSSESMSAGQDGSFENIFLLIGCFNAPPYEKNRLLMLEEEIKKTEACQKWNERRPFYRPSEEALCRLNKAFWRALKDIHQIMISDMKKYNKHNDFYTIWIHNQCLCFKLFHHGGPSRHSEHGDHPGGGHRGGVRQLDHRTLRGLSDVPLEAVSTTMILAIIILATIIGNVLVITSVFPYRPSLQNMFIVSLAVSNVTVAVLVMPLNVACTPHVPVEVRLPSLKDVAHVRRPVLHDLHPAPLRHRPGQVLGDSRSHQLRQQEDSEEGARHDCRRLGGQHDHLCPTPHRMERLARGLH
ncbi:hypothetical protein CEXT_339681 [Caerostris extrusa]|uniref:Uncharacterized protein n=1 Tax=Caerostris extrusa TaxID=172846 RepID=A0AAV4XQ33_CAEEX|nr:hypothetical protein CEXT_339681 [Caerostris extrusa]